jgi:methylase of polypeptide subunit release factors
MRAQPVADGRAANTLGTVLRGLGYSEDAIIAHLGEDAYGADRREAPVAARRLPQSKLGTAMRALFLQLPVAADEATRAFGAKGMAALEATGLASTGAELVAGARVLPVGDLLVAADGDPDANGDDPPDYVAPYTPTSKTCDLLTPRRRVDRALDVGTGSGVLALLAARHARAVVATDVNERALAFGRLNAALNDLGNVEFRTGSLFEPVAGETFDLITCNAPFVVSPDNHLAYRDSGFEGDGVTERIVREGAAHLAEGGYAALLGSWLGADEDSADDRPLEWTERLGCDRWLISFRTVDPLEHAATWNSPLAGDPERFGAALDRWLSYFERLGSSVVTEGAVLLHRRKAKRHTTRVDDVDEDALDDAADQIERAFETRIRLSALKKPSALLDERLLVAMPLAFQREVAPRGTGVAVVDSTIALGEGTNDVLEAPPAVLDVVGALNGDRALGRTVDRVAKRLQLDERETARLQRDAVGIAHELLELGALRLVE